MILDTHFFEAYDLLPSEYKKELYSQNPCPTCSDLEAAWRMVQEEGSFKELLEKYARSYDRDLHNELQAEKKRQHDLEKQRKKDDEHNARMKAIAERQSREGMVHVTSTARIRNFGYDKHFRLIEKVSAEKAIDDLTKKKAEIVKPQKWLTVQRSEYISQKELERRRREQENKKAGFDMYSAKKFSAASVSKRLHNSY